MFYFRQWFNIISINNYFYFSRPRPIVRRSKDIVIRPEMPTLWTINSITNIAKGFPNSLYPQ